MKQLNWIVTVGKAVVKKNEIKYSSETSKNQFGKDEILTSIVKSNTGFDNGEIFFKVNSKSKTGHCQVILSNPMILIGLNVSDKLYGIAKLNSLTKQFDPISVTADPDTFDTEKDYKFRIRVSGSKIELYVNDVLVASAIEQISQSQISFFFSSENEIIVKDIDISVKNPKAFVVMQFTDEYNDLYKEVIRPVTENCGYDCERADEAHTTNPILQDIIQSIKESSVIIADITPNNPNVFYEVGYAHAINKPTILLSDRKQERLPFDISGFRALFYDNTIVGKSAMEKSLKKYLDTLTAT